MTRAGWIALASLLCALSGCTKQAPPPARADLRELGGNTFEIIPREDQLPYCLVFTRSEKNVIRQLTMTHENTSLRCRPGLPIGNVRFRVPAAEGPVKVHVFFSDQRLHAESLAEDLQERGEDPSFRPIDLRLPGNVHIQSFDFVPKPEAEKEATVGGRIGEGGEVVAPDGGGTDAGGGPGPAEAMGESDGGTRVPQ